MISFHDSGLETFILIAKDTDDVYLSFCLDWPD